MKEGKGSIATNGELGKGSTEKGEKERKRKRKGKKRKKERIYKDVMV